MRALIRLLLVGIIIAGILAIALVWMAGGVQSPRSTLVPPVVAPVETRVETSSAASELVVVSWNVSWAYGWGSEGSGARKPKMHFEGAVDKIGAVLRDLRPDIVLLQEVDFDAGRSYGIDEALRVASVAGLRHVAEAPSWRANWIPFPYWPPSEHYGRMLSGGAVLSRYPIDTNEVELLDKPEANPFWYNLFYPFRFVQRADVVIGGVRVRVFNTHLEAFDKANRIAQAERLKSKIQGMITSFTLLGGDLNSVPPESTLKSGYPDETGVKTDHEDDRTVELIRSITGLLDTTAQEDFREHEPRYFTFPAHEPSRKLDYIFAGAGFQVLEARVVHEAGAVSDHLPILARLKIKK